MVIEQPALAVLKTLYHRFENRNFCLQDSICGIIFSDARKPLGLVFDYAASVASDPVDSVW
jgi:hypothetical protein